MSRVTDGPVGSPGPVVDPAVTLEIDNGVGRIRFDDGKANVLGVSTIAAIHSCVDRCVDPAVDVDVVVIEGRPGFFSAGLDLKGMQGGDAERRTLGAAGRGLGIRLFVLDRPLVVVATGHALAAGAAVLLAGDVRFGVDGAARYGLNEVAVGFGLSASIVELARARMPADRLELIVSGTTLGGPEARAAGLLDVVAAPDELPGLVEEAVARLAALDRVAFGRTKRFTRAPAIEAIERTLPAGERAAFVAAGAALRAI